MGLALSVAMLWVAVPQPPLCPWNQTQFDAVRQITPGASTPVNGFIWWRIYGGGALSLHDATGAMIEHEELRTPLVSTGGALVQIRARGGFRPGEVYEARSDSLRPGPQQVDTSTDTEAPQAPVIIGTRNPSSPYELCPTAGVWVDLASSSEPLIYLVESADGSEVLEVGANVGRLSPNLFIPSPPNTELTLRIVAVDLAGNRSPPAMLSANSGAVPQIQGKVPPPDSGSLGGCRCARYPVGSAWLLLGLLSFACSRSAMKRS